MRKYILRRLLLNIPVLFLITIGAFGMLRLTPGDAVLAQMTEVGTIKMEDVEKVRQQLGLDKPFFQEYGRWVSRMFRGDMGTSLRGGYDVRSQLFHTLPVSIELGLIAIIIGILIGWPIGIISAIRQNTMPDYAGRLFAIGGLSFPDFWLATMFLVFVPIWFGYLPRLGYVPFPQDPLANLGQFIWPGLILGVRMSATSMRMLRSTMLEVLRQDYIRTAWSKGMRERAVISRHALKNAMIPVITILGGQVALVFGGTLILEQMFALPGVGRLTFDAINYKDWPQVQANVTFMATIIVMMNLIVDITYAWLDPRIRYS